MRVKSIFVLAVLLTGIVEVHGQDRATNISRRTGSDERPEQKQDRQEQAIKVTLVSSGGLWQPKEKFKVGEHIAISIYLTNTGTEPTGAAIIDNYYQHRPLLMKDGQSVPYLEKVAEQLLLNGDNPPIGFRVIFVALEPNKLTEFNVVHLSDWYAPLTLGKYELTMKNRLTKNWLPQGSNKVKFEIVP